MTELPWLDEPETEPDERSRAIQNVMTAAALTPLVLFVSPPRAVSSAEAALVAVASGVVAGIAWALVTDHLALERQNDLETTVVLYSLSLALQCCRYSSFPTTTRPPCCCSRSPSPGTPCSHL